MARVLCNLSLFFFNDSAPTEIYTLSLPDALPILSGYATLCRSRAFLGFAVGGACSTTSLDRKITRLNSSHDQISYTVFCLKKKKTPYIRFFLNQLISHLMNTLNVVTAT